MVGLKAGGVGQGAANGPGSGNPRKPLDTSSKAQSNRAKAGWIKRKMQAYAEANPENKAAERAPSRVEIAELAQRAMPEAVQKLELIMHTSRSDTAAVLAYNALKDTAYGKDPQSISVSMEFESLTDDELKSAIAAEIGSFDAPHGSDAGRATQASPDGEPN